MAQYGKSLDDIRKDGSDFAFALRLVFGKGNADMSSVLYIARQFAKMVGYTDSDESWAYVEGFMEWFKNQPTPAIASPEVPS